MASIYTLFFFWGAVACLFPDRETDYYALPYIVSEYTSETLTFFSQCNLHLNTTFVDETEYILKRQAPRNCIFINFCPLEDVPDHLVPGIKFPHLKIATSCSSRGPATEQAGLVLLMKVLWAFSVIHTDRFVLSGFRLSTDPGISGHIFRRVSLQSLPILATDWVFLEGVSSSVARWVFENTIIGGGTGALTLVVTNIADAKTLDFLDSLKHPTLMSLGLCQMPNLRSLKCRFLCENRVVKYLSLSTLNRLKGISPEVVMAVASHQWEYILADAHLWVYLNELPGRLINVEHLSLLFCFNQVACTRFSPPPGVPNMHVKYVTLVNGKGLHTMSIYTTRWLLLWVCPRFTDLETIAIHTSTLHACLVKYIQDHVFCIRPYPRLKSLVINAHHCTLLDPSKTELPQSSKICYFP
ncbi:hypothetical protein NEDG_01580 [Nematocida displodere]|uniref:F-box domain-containing protein n=1 Tax=Nematocida displodere TaxID=1805483 RepID=A0A177EGU2_9MICR|nr:hypothetical protein NEDG_01580 [Nematocida displodere]